MAMPLSVSSSTRGATTGPDYSQTQQTSGNNVVLSGFTSPNNIGEILNTLRGPSNTGGLFDGPLFGAGTSSSLNLGGAGFYLLLGGGALLAVVLLKRGRHKGTK